jgi:pectinesterase
MKKKLISLALMLMGILAIAQPDTLYHLVVATDGSGDFTRVQDAINAVPDLRKEETRIFIKSGVYKEKLTLPATKTNVTFIGEDVEKTILTYDDFAQKKNAFGENIGTSGSSSFFLYGDGFTARNITFENSAGPVGQAVAVRISGDKVRFVNCRFLGNQDTLYPQGASSRQYYKNCYIEGTVDFIFGWSTAVFDECTLFCKKGGYITAASTDSLNPFGFVFIRCTITGSAPAGSVYLGRPWRVHAHTAFIECNLGSVVHPAGWHNWSKPEAEKLTRYAEYKNRGEGAVTDNRVAWAKQLTPDEKAMYTIESIFSSLPAISSVHEPWNPVEK